jgi:hypothetical protein
METLVVISTITVTGIWGVSRIVRRLRAPSRGATCSSGCDACGCAATFRDLPPCGDVAGGGLPSRRTGDDSDGPAAADAEE